MGKFKGWPIVLDYPDRKSHESNPPVQPMVDQTALLSACVNRNLSCPLLVNVLFPPQHSLSAISSAQSPTGGRSRLQPLWLPTWLWIHTRNHKKKNHLGQECHDTRYSFAHYCCCTVCMLAIQPSPIPIMILSLIWCAQFPPVAEWQNFQPFLSLRGSTVFVLFAGMSLNECSRRSCD